LGPRSGIVDIEADTPQAEQTFAELFAGSEVVTPTFASKRGKHRLFRFDERLAQFGKAALHVGALEVRIGANGRAAHSLLPPSRVEDVERQWLVGLDDCNIATLPTSVLFRIEARLRESKTQLHESAESTVFSAPAVSAVYQEDDPAVEQAICDTLPVEPHTRNRRIFDFARRLRAIPSVANSNVKDLRAVVVEWHRRALPTIATKAFEETWLDFAKAWQSVKFAAGTEPILAIWETAKKRLPPAAAQYDDPTVRRLVALCCELQGIAGDKPFFLDCRTAGRLLEVPHVQAARWLKLLCLDGILQLVTPGIRRRAAEYRYIASVVR
jgi:hypothetical protein